MPTPRSIDRSVDPEDWLAPRVLSNTSRWSCTRTRTPEAASASTTCADVTVAFQHSYDVAQQCRTLSTPPKATHVCFSVWPPSANREKCS